MFILTLLGFRGGFVEVQKMWVLSPSGNRPSFMSFLPESHVIKVVMQPFFSPIFILPSQCHPHSPSLLSHPRFVSSSRLSLLLPFSGSLLKYWSSVVGLLAHMQRQPWPEKAYKSLYWSPQNFQGRHRSLQNTFSHFIQLFSRYHVGESLIPSARHYLRFIDAEKKMMNCGFTRKVLALFFLSLCWTVNQESLKIAWIRYQV